MGAGGHSLRRDIVHICQRQAAGARQGRQVPRDDEPDLVDGDKVILVPKNVAEGADWLPRLIGRKALCLWSQLDRSLADAKQPEQNRVLEQAISTEGGLIYILDIIEDERDVFQNILKTPLGLMGRQRPCPCR